MPYSFNLDDVPEAGRVRSADGTRIAAMRRRDTDDLWDHDSTYEIAVWDAETGYRIEAFTRAFSSATATSEERGRPVRSLRFGDANRLLLIYDDGSEEPARGTQRRAPEEDITNQAREALDQARVHAANSDHDEAQAARTRALSLLASLPECASRAAYEAMVRHEAQPEDATDEPALRQASETLLAAGDWANAMYVLSILARLEVARGEFGKARRDLVSAIGCAEAGGAEIYGPTLLRKLAEAEIRGERPAPAIDALHQAIRRLKGVLKLSARLEEAKCLEALGDAWFLLHDWDEAKARWREAADRQMSLDRKKEAARIRAKFDPRTP